MPWLSISIDLTGSTAVKQALVQLTEGNRKRRHELYDEYLKILFGIERDLYSVFLNIPSFDFQNLFLVKMIGDEFWYLYEFKETSGPDFVALAGDILTALTELIAKERHLHFDDRLAPEDREGWDELPPATQFDLPVKVCTDIVQEPIEVNVSRYEYLKDIVTQIQGRPSPVYRIDREFAEYCGRLNLGSPDIFGTGQRLTTRTDYIGLEIDRFFRLTKLAIPKLLLVGQDLLDLLPHHIEAVSPAVSHLDIKQIDFRFPGNGPDTVRSWKKHLISETVRPDRMKGIGDDYRVNHLFGATTFGEAVFAPLAGVESMMEPTRTFLAKYGFFGLDRRWLIP